MPTAIKARVRLKPRSAAIASKPSILDPWLRGDLWIQLCPTGQCLVLYIQSQPVSILTALPFDLESLNTRLHDMRHRVPRGMTRES